MLSTLYEITYGQPAIQYWEILYTLVIAYSLPLLALATLTMMFRDKPGEFSDLPGWCKMVVAIGVAQLLVVLHSGGLSVVLVLFVLVQLDAPATAVILAGLVLVASHLAIFYALFFGRRTEHTQIRSS